MSLLFWFSSPSGSGSRYVIASNRNRPPTTFALSASANIMKYDGVGVIAPSDTGLSKVRAYFQNSYSLPNSGLSSTSLVSFKIQASVEYPIGGTLYPLLFNGLDETTLNPGDGIWSDFTSTINIPAGAYYRIRIDREHLGTSGNYNQLSNALLGPATTPGKTDHATSGTDNTVHKSRGGTYPAFTSTTTTFAHTLVQGIPLVAGTKSVFIVGDSISRGSGDTGTAPTQQGDYISTTSPTAPYINAGNVGWVESSIGTAYPYYSIAVPGRVVTSSVFTDAILGSQFALIDNSPATHCVLALGVNDLMQGRTPAQVLSDLISAVAVIKARYPGIKVYPCTITPVTNSTDAWATTANQTFTGTLSGASITWSNFNGTDDTTGRRKLNADIRAGLVTGADGYIEVALSAQDATDPRLWRVDLGTPTKDGIHPQAVLHRLIASDANIPGIINPATTSGLLLEDGFYLLLEDGSKLLLES